MRWRVRLPVNKLVTWVNIGMIACIQFFFITGRAGLSFVGFAFYVFVGIFSLTLIAQFWSFANDIYRKPEGDRLFPIIAVGATAGAPLGAALAARLFARGVSPWLMMEIASALLALHTAMYAWVHRRSSSGSRQETKKESGNGFMMVLQSPYLRLIALLLVVQNLINTVGEYILANLVTAQADTIAAATPGFNKGAYIGEFYGDYFLGVNILSVLIQMFVVSRIAKKLGLGGVLMALPVVALGAYGMVLSGVGIAMLRWMKTAENSADYSVMNTGKQMVWLPTTHQEKYAGKQAVDTFFVRFGDVLAAGVVFLGTQVLTFSTQEFAGINIVLIFFSVLVIYLLMRENRRLTGASTASVPAPGGSLAAARG